MNREIKFRVWSKSRSEWVHNMLLLACIDGVPFLHLVEVNQDNNEVKDHIYNASVLDCVIQQYTGMTDKNGREIYEGDIVIEKHDGVEGEANVGTVFFAAGTFFINGDGPLYDHTYSQSPDLLEDYVVIGNKFENPDLLK